MRRRTLRNVSVHLLVRFRSSALRTFVFIELLESTSNGPPQELVSTAVSLGATLTFTQTSETSRHPPDRQTGSVLTEVRGQGSSPPLRQTPVPVDLGPGLCPAVEVQVHCWVFQALQGPWDLVLECWKDQME